MNPCSKNRQLIVWLAVDALEIDPALKLRAHLETCEGCREYLNEISGVTAKLTAAEANSDILASESFHRAVIARLRAEGSTSVWEIVTGYPHRILANWRLTLATATMLVVAIATLVVTLRHPGISSSAQPGGQIVLAPRAVTDLPPTVAQYRMVANRSLDTLDDLLTRQGNRLLPPTPIYTASTRAPASASD